MIRRNAAITAASIAAVVLAGGAAIGANVGILNAADNSPLGELAAEVAPDLALLTDATVLVPATVLSVADAPALLASAGPISEDGMSVDTVAGAATQTFAIGVAGTIQVSELDGSLAVTAVTTSAGWSWQPGPDTEGSVKVTFSNGAETFEFYASIEADGSLAARVDQPITVTAAAATSTSPNSHEDDDHEDDDHEDDDHEDDDHEDDDHDDDDHDDDDHDDDDHDDDDEYEGKDDDD